MKLKLIRDSEGGLAVINANTSELVEGVERIEIEASSNGISAVIHMCHDALAIDTPSVAPGTKAKTECSACAGTGRYTGLSNQEDCDNCGGTGHV